LGQVKKGQYRKVNLGKYVCMSEEKDRSKIVERNRIEGLNS